MLHFEISVPPSQWSPFLVFLQENVLDVLSAVTSFFDEMFHLRKGTKKKGREIHDPAKLIQSFYLRYLYAWIMFFRVFRFAGVSFLVDLWISTEINLGFCGISVILRVDFEIRGKGLSLRSIEGMDMSSVHILRSFCVQSSLRTERFFSMENSLCSSLCFVVGIFCPCPSSNAGFQSFSLGFLQVLLIAS